MSDTGPPVEINYDSIETETVHAILFNVEEGDPANFEPPVQHWIPRSQLIEQTDSHFTIPEWLAIAKELV